MSGIEFLKEATVLQPAAGRVLLTAYADSSAAIEAINKVKLNYLIKPWQPPEQNLFPVLSDLLDDWSARSHHDFDGVHVIGTRWSPETHRLKDFLAKSQVPYRWAEPSAAMDARVRAALGEGARKFPVVVFADGTVLESPDETAVAGKLGLSTSPEREFYDVIVVGAGPAGLACALYCSTEGLKTVLVERETDGFSGAVAVGACRRSVSRDSPL